jgi:hypothetical protein
MDFRSNIKITKKFLNDFSDYRNDEIENEKIYIDGNEKIKLFTSQKAGLFVLNEKTIISIFNLVKKSKYENYCFLVKLILKITDYDFEGAEEFLVVIISDYYTRKNVVIMTENKLFNEEFSPSNEIFRVIAKQLKIRVKLYNENNYYDNITLGSNEPWSTVKIRNESGNLCFSGNENTFSVSSKLFNNMFDYKVNISSCSDYNKQIMGFINFDIEIASKFDYEGFTIDNTIIYSLSLKEDFCCICHSDDWDIKYGCGHRAHASCTAVMVNNWNVGEKKCPLCKKKIEKIVNHEFLNTELK